MNEPSASDKLIALLNWKDLDDQIETVQIRHTSQRFGFTAETDWCITVWAGWDACAHFFGDTMEECVDKAYAFMMGNK